MFNINNVKQNVKIFNMSPPIWLRESFNCKKKPKANLQNYSEILKKKSNDDVPTKNVFADFQKATLENKELKTENDLVKTELGILRTENENLLSNMRINQEKFEKQITNLKNEIKNNENNFVDNGRKCLVQLKKFADEINELKESKNQLAAEYQEKEKEFFEKIRNLEDETKKLQENIVNEESQNEENAQKSLKYKRKLKFAVALINDLNIILAQYESKQFSDKECETIDREIGKLHASISSCTRSRAAREVEELILSDIFFKPRAFCESELMSVQDN